VSKFINIVAHNNAVYHAVIKEVLQIRTRHNSNLIKTWPSCRSTQCSSPWMESLEYIIPLKSETQYVAFLVTS